jgi:hypothetical protein
MTGTAEAWRAWLGKRRGGDNGVLLAALLDCCAGFRLSMMGFVARPWLPGICTRLGFGPVNCRGMRIDFTIDRTGAEVGRALPFPPGRVVVFLDGYSPRRRGTAAAG